jgi:hypothetical protein
MQSRTDGPKLACGLVILERKEGRKGQNIPSSHAMKSCQAEHRSRNGVFEFQLFRSSVR